MNVSIIGGGNIGTLTAAELANKGFDVCVYTSKANSWDGSLEVYNGENHLLFEVEGITATNNIGEAVEDANMIIITYPAQLFKKLSKDMDPYVCKNQYIGFIPGTGGVEFIFNNLVSKGCILFGLQRVPSVARLKEVGKSVYNLGKRDALYVATFQKGYEGFIKNFIENLFDLPCNMLDNYLGITLTPSNTILHTSRLYSLFNNQMIYGWNVLFYEEWNDESSELLIQCDSQVQDLCNVLGVTGVKSLKDHYESYSVEEMTNKITSIDSLKGLKTPMILTDDGWIPDFSSRYFSTDFPFGLKVLIEIANVMNVDVSYLEKIWDWYCKTCNPKAFFNLKDFNISSKKEFEEYYSLNE